MQRSFSVLLCTTLLSLLLVCFHSYHQAVHCAVVATGSISIDATQEVHFFIPPSHKNSIRLLTEQMCEGDRCSIVKSVHPSTAPSYVYDVHFKVTIWYRDLHYCCSILACRTVKNFLRKYITNDLIKGCADSDFVHYGPLYNSEGITISLTSFFMNGKHYEDLIYNHTTTLILPQNQHKNITFYGIVQVPFRHHVHNGGMSKCYLSNNDDVQLECSPVRYYPLYHKCVRTFLVAGSAAVMLETFTRRVNILEDFKVNYTCMGYYKHGLDYSNIWTMKTKIINVSVKKDRQILLPENVTFALEDTTHRLNLDILCSDDIIVSISVSARSGVRAITTITPLKHSHVIWHYLLEFHSLQITMAGAYDVNVETESGPTIVGSFILIVSQKPRVEVTPTIVNAGLDQEASFDCIAYGTDIRGIEWNRYGLPMNKNVRKEKFTDKLTIGLRVTFQTPQYSDAGDYTCKVWTGHPNHVTIKFAQLFVFYPGSPNIDPTYTVGNKTFRISEYNTTWLNKSSDNWTTTQNPSEEYPTNILPIDPLTIAIISAATLGGLLMLFILVFSCCCVRNRIRLMRDTYEKEHHSEQNTEQDDTNYSSN